MPLLFPGSLTPFLTLHRFSCLHRIKLFPSPVPSLEVFLLQQSLTPASSSLVPTGDHFCKGTDRLALPCVQPQVCYPRQGGESDGDGNFESLALQRPASFSTTVCQHTARQENESGIPEVLLFRAILAGSLQNHLFSCWGVL